MWVVRIWEPNPPAGTKPVEWYLLTTEAVPDIEAAWEVVGWYQCRWIVEEYHKAQKTGCQVEDVQFTTTEALKPTIALLSVIATILLNLRSMSRQPEDQDIYHYCGGPLLCRSLEQMALQRRTRHDHRGVLLCRRSSGRSPNRKADGHPGWLVL